jgi:hypothetical protein
MTSTTRTAPSSASRLRWRRAAAVLLLLPSIELVLYAGFLPAPAGIAIAGQPVFGFGVSVVTLLGFGGIAAATGVWRGRAWGRSSGVAATLVILAYHAWLPLQRSIGPTGALDLVSLLAGALVVPVACSAFILFALARRWTPAGGPEAAGTPSGTAGRR